MRLNRHVRNGTHGGVGGLLCLESPTRFYHFTLGLSPTLLFSKTSKKQRMYVHAIDGTFACYHKNSFDGAGNKCREIRFCPLWTAAAGWYGNGSERPCTLRPDKTGPIPPVSNRKGFSHMPAKAKAKTVTTERYGLTTWQRMKKYRAFYLMFIPLLICLIVFSYFPMFGILYAFTNYTPFHAPSFIGLENFQRLFAQPGFWQAFVNTLQISTLKLIFTTLGSIVLALLLDEIRTVWFKKAAQTIVYIPHFMSWVVVASIFTMFLSPKNGLINGVIEAFGGTPIYFLADEKWWRPWFYMITTWKEIGWGTIIYVAALSGVDMEQHEAAVIDGATRLQRVLYLTLPAISGTIVTVFILNLAKVLNLFDPVWVLQNSMVINSSDVLETYVYRMGISGSQYGLSTAAGLFKSLISVLLVTIGNLLSKKITGEEVL